MKTIAEKIKERAEEQRELEKLIPLGPTKVMRKRVAKSELWNREQRQELAKLADAFLDAKAKARA
jgi:hypothetical protein